MSVSSPPPPLKSPYEDLLVMVLCHVDSFYETVAEDLQRGAIGVFEDDTQLVVDRVHASTQLVCGDQLESDSLDKRDIEFELLNEMRE